MLVAIGEVQSTVLKAARGSYLSWGVAEEAGRAAAWLETRGLPAATAVAGLVEENDAIPMARLAPIDPFSQTIKGEGRLCPFLAGTAISDVDPKGTIDLLSVAHPLLLVSFAAQIGEGQGTDLSVVWPGVEIVCGTNGLTVRGMRADLLKSYASKVSIGPSTQKAEPVKNRLLRAEVDNHVWATLEGYAHRTYVPASEASRLAGAGAGLTDND